jgi:metal-responsive CopG/Arc/MetJ family transcriptional regulator
VRQSITVTLPGPLKARVDAFAAERGMSRSEVVRASLRAYLFARQFRDLRRRMVARAQAQEIFTDQDVFDRVS